MKQAFDIPAMLNGIAVAVAPFPKAAMFELYEQGYSSLFEQLVSCIISIRTLDETTIPVSLRLFARARTPEQVAALSYEELEQLLYGTTFPGQKAHTISGIAQTAIQVYQGDLPADAEKLIALKGVGPKCANLALGVAHQQEAISVDIHVHRVVNRWGLVRTSTPEKTLLALQQGIPRPHWIDINRLLMPFGKHLCTGHRPHCTTCPVLNYCHQIGVASYR